MKKLLSQIKPSPTNEEIYSTTHLSNVDFDDLEKVSDSIRMRGQIGGVLIALGGLFSIAG